jgi:large subunit ribosomal protein L22
MTMEFARSQSKYIRVSPRKARLAADLIRGLPVHRAEEQLKYCNLKSGRLLQKTLKSAVANAELQLDMRKENLYIAEIRVDVGPTLKRAKARNKGGRSPILKRTSHFTVVVGSR